MGKEVISDFLVKLGFDNKEVIRGIKATETALGKFKQRKPMRGKPPELDQKLRSESILYKQRLKDRLKLHKLDMSLQDRRKQVMAQTNFMGLNSAARGDIGGRAKKATTKQEFIDIQTAIKGAAKDQRAFNRQNSKLFTKGKGLQGMLRGLSSSMGRFGGMAVGATTAIGTLVAAIAAFTLGMVQAIKVTQEFQALEASFKAVSKNGAEAAENLEFIKQLAQDLPISLVQSADEFKNLLAAGREAVGAQGMQQIFKAFTEYGSALQIDAQRMSRVMVALGQVFNKGTLMAEEVKNQIGENLAGSLQIFAKSLGMTTEEFFKAMERGELIASEVMPKIAEGMAKAARNNDALNESLKTSRSQWQILKNELTLLFDGKGSKQLDKGLAELLQQIKITVKRLKPLVQFLMFSIGQVVRSLAFLLKLATNTFKPFENILKAFAEPLERVFGSFEKLANMKWDWLSNASQIISMIISPLTIAGGLLEEIVNVFTGHAEGILAGTGDTIGERLSSGVIGKGLGELWKVLMQQKAKLVDWARETGSSMAQGFVQGLGPLGNVFGPLIGKNTSASQAAQPTTAAPPSQGFFGAAASIIFNVDGKEAMNEVVDLRQDTMLAGAL